MAITWNGTGTVLPFGPGPTAPQINWHDPLCQGLVFDASYAGHTARNGFDLVNQTKSTYTGTSISGGAFGFQRTFVNATDKDAYTSGAPVNGLHTWTIETLIKFNADAFGQIFGKSSTTSPSGQAFISLLWDDTSHAITLGVGFNTTDGNFITAANFLNGQWLHLVVSYDDTSLSNIPSFYKNGALQALGTTTAPVGSRISDDTVLQIGNVSGQSFGIAADYKYLRIWNRVLSQQDVTALAGNPWLVYRQPKVSGAVNTVASTHATTGAITGPGATIAGTSVHKTKHTTTGAITGPGSTIAGTSVHKTKHTTSGTITGPGSAIAGTAKRFRTHATTGAITGPGTSLSGTAKRFRSHPTSGAIRGAGALIVGTALRHGVAVTHGCTGVLVGAGASIAGIAVRFGWTVNTNPSTVWTLNASSTGVWAANAATTTTWTANPASSGSWTTVPGVTTTWTRN